MVCPSINGNGQNVHIPSKLSKKKFQSDFQSFLTPFTVDFGFSAFTNLSCHSQFIYIL